jgi:hypothetical protein
MSALFTFCTVVPIVLLAISLPLQVGMFLADRVFLTTPSPRLFHFADGLLRGALIFVSLDALAFFGFFVMFGTSLLNDQQTAFSALLAIYALVALGMNFPGIPLRLHSWVFLPAQLLLLPVFVLWAAEGASIFYLAIPLALFVGLWFWSLHSRLANEEVFSP